MCETQEELDAALTKECNDQFDMGLDEPTITIDADMILCKTQICTKTTQCLKKCRLETRSPADIANWILIQMQEL